MHTQKIFIMTAARCISHFKSHPTGLSKEKVPQRSMPTCWMLCQADWGAVAKPPQSQLTSHSSFVPLEPLEGNWREECNQVSDVQNTEAGAMTWGH